MDIIDITRNNKNAWVLLISQEIKKNAWVLLISQEIKKCMGIIDITGGKKHRHD